MKRFWRPNNVERTFTPGESVTREESSAQVYIFFNYFALNHIGDRRYRTDITEYKGQANALSHEGNGRAGQITI